LKYQIIRTDVADAQIRRLILSIAEKFGRETALRKLSEIEKRIMILSDYPDIGTQPRYLALKRQGYRVLILDKDLVFYKVNERQKEVVIYAVVDQREDFLSIIQGL
jgi:toxin ParE1/3/4